MIILKGNPTTKKNSQKIITNPATGRPMVIQGERYQAYEQACFWQLVWQSEKIKSKLPKPPYNVQCVYYRDSNRRVDLGNLLAATCDILVNAGILPDDNFKVIASHDGSRVLVDKQNPRVEITITEVKKDGAD